VAQRAIQVTHQLAQPPNKARIAKSCAVNLPVYLTVGTKVSTAPTVLSSSMLKGEIPMWGKVPIIKGLAETERFELSVRMYPYDGLANPDVTIPKPLNSGNSPCFHPSKPRAERATEALARNLCRHKSRHTSQGGKNDLQNRRLRAEREQRQTRNERICGNRKTVGRAATLRNGPWHSWAATGSVYLAPESHRIWISSNVVFGNLTITAR